jgi:hypothetical protein
MRMASSTRLTKIFPSPMRPVRAAAIELGVALLAAVTAGLQNGHSLDACLEQRILDCIQLRGLENCFNFEHVQNASLDSVTGGTAG